MPAASQEVLIFPSRFAPDGRIRVNNTQPAKQHICKPDEKIGLQKSCFFPNAPVLFL